MLFFADNDEMGILFSRKKDKDAEESSEVEYDYFKEDIRRRIATYLNKKNNLENRIVALRKIGIFVMTCKAKLYVSI